MKLIDKHLLKEYIVPLFYCVCGFSLVYVVIGMFGNGSKLLHDGMPLREFARFYLHYAVAYADRENVSIVARILPASVLAASLYSLSIFARNNELTALRASGVSLRRLVVPFLGVAFACSLLGMFVQEAIAPRSSRIVDQLYRQWRKKDPENRVIFRYRWRNEEARHTWYVNKMDLDSPTRLWGVRITVDRPNSTARARVMDAQRADWETDHWVLYGAAIREYGPDDQPAGGVLRPSGAYPVPELTETPTDLSLEADIDNMARYSTSFEVVRYLSRRVSLQAAELASKRVDAHRRLAMPWVSFVAGLLVIPASLRRRRQGALAGVLYGVGLFLLYYCAIYVAAFLGKKQLVWPWLSAWLPNIGFFVAGSVMISRMK